MARKKTTSPTESQPPSLLVTKEDALQRLQEQLERGQELLQRQLHTEDDLRTVRNDFDRWHEFVFDVLSRFFSNNSLAIAFRRWNPGSIPIYPSPRQKVNWFHKRMDFHLNQLRSVIERLDLMASATPGIQPTAPPNSNDVFIVHGHDDAARLAASALVTQLGLNPIVLHEQPNRGRTIIEKLEAHTSAGFALVLLTPDDVGGSADSEAEYSPRARQNVILELGFFCGVLGRARVCVLHKGDVEIPSDYMGVVYVPLDEAGAWQLRIAKEMQDAGYDIDLNDL